MKKYILITGASSGIGKAMAFEFASHGHNLILTARRRDLLESIKRDIESMYEIKVIVEDVDLTKIDEVNKFYNDIRHYEIEGLINNAGFGDFNQIFDIDIKLAERMINLNVVALTNLTLKYIKDYIDKQGTIINVSSVSGYFIPSLGAVYSATKFYVSAFSEGIAKQLKKQKSRLSMKILAPSATESEFLDNVIENYKYKFNKDEYKKSLKWITSEEIAKNAYELFNSEKTIGIISLEKNEFKMLDNILNR